MHDTDLMGRASTACSQDNASVRTGRHRVSRMAGVLAAKTSRESPFIRINMALWPGNGTRRLMRALAPQILGARRASRGLKLRPTIAAAKGLPAMPLLRRYVTWCPRNWRFASVQGAAQLHRGSLCRFLGSVGCFPRQTSALRKIVGPQRLVSRRCPETSATQRCIQRAAPRVALCRQSPPEPLDGAVASDEHEHRV